MAYGAIGVGRSSSRTPFKHWILNTELGRLCGIFANPSAAASVPAKADPFCVIDLCAGDGHCDNGANSSPSIITRHLGWASQRGVQVDAHLIEKNAGTFEVLCGNIARQPWLSLTHADAREWVSPEFHKKQAVFIHSDPNHIHDWPVTPDLIAGMSETTTMLATLGCNVGGLKMMSRDQRMCWYDHVAMCVNAMPSYHDAVLVSLDGDSSQWAYLLRVPSKWSASTCAKILSTGRQFSKWDFRMASFRSSRNDFENMQHHLFLTTKERANVE